MWPTCWDVRLLATRDRAFSSCPRDVLHRQDFQIPTFTFSQAPDNQRRLWSTIRHDEVALDLLFVCPQGSDNASPKNRFTHTGGFRRHGRQWSAAS